jgi:hypothetical protein
LLGKQSDATRGLLGVNQLLQVVLAFHDAVLDSVHQLFGPHDQSLSLLSLELLVSAIPRELDSGEYAEPVLIDLLLNALLSNRVGDQTFPLKVHHHQK